MSEFESKGNPIPLSLAARKLQGKDTQRYTHAHTEESEGAFLKNYVCLNLLIFRTTIKTRQAFVTNDLSLSLP